MAISNPLSPRLIYNEINSTSHGANAQIGSGVTMSSLRTSSITYGNANSAPDIMSDWNGYAHAQTFTSSNAPTYSIRLGTSTADYSLLQRTTEPNVVPTSCTAEGGIFLTRIIAGNEGSGTTKIYADIMKDDDLDDLSNAEVDYSRIYAADNSYGALGSFANNTQPDLIISIPVYDVTVTMGGAFISGNGTGFADNDITGLASNHTIIPGSAKGAVDASVSGFGVQTKQAYFRYDLTISKTGWTSTSLSSFVSWSYNRATAEL